MGGGIPPIEAGITRVFAASPIRCDTEFRNNLDRLIGVAKSARTAIMCAEAVSWRCHCSLTADALVARGIEVF